MEDEKPPMLTAVFDESKPSVREAMKDGDEPEEASVLMTCEVHLEGERQRSCQRLVDAGVGVEARGPQQMKPVTA